MVPGPIQRAIASASNAKQVRDLDAELIIRDAIQIPKDCSLVYWKSLVASRNRPEKLCPEMEWVGQEWTAKKPASALLWKLALYYVMEEALLDRTKLVTLPRLQSCIE